MSQGSARVFDNHQIQTILISEFSAPLIITTIGLMIYGINCHQVVVYYSNEGKRDPFLTRLWVLILMLMNSASSLHQVYFDWSFSVTGFTEGNTGQLSRLNGNVVVLYSSVLMLVQLFWITLLDGLFLQLKRWLLLPLGLGSVSSFILAVVVGVLSSKQTVPTWPDFTTSIFLRSMLALNLAVDLVILISILTQFDRMRKEFTHLHQTFSKLSWIFSISSTINTLVVLGELIINAPRTTNSFVSITITLAAVISPLYSYSMLSILNSRGDFRFEEYESSIKESRRPQMDFTNDEASARQTLSADSPSIQSRYATRSLDSLSGRKNQKRARRTRLEHESQTHFGIQTI